MPLYPCVILPKMMCVCLQQCPSSQMQRLALDFTNFSLEELRKHIGLYVLQGVAPSLQVEVKLKPQVIDRVHGNDMVYSSFGKKAQNRHREFKCFFATQNPMIPTPERKKFPNWKIRPLLKWINKVGPESWRCGKSLSVDEMTMGFKGKHQDKLWITCKKAGDGFQSDAICDDGFCFQIYMRNDPPPQKYIIKNLSPLHSRVMWLFDSLNDNAHQVAMDNLYNSAAFCRACRYNHERKVLVHGVARKGGRGVPACVLQTEVLNRHAQIAVRGTVKAAVLEGDPGCPNLIATSVYDTKPVHYLSMISEEISWQVEEKKVYNVDTGGVEFLKFLRVGFTYKFRF